MAFKDTMELDSNNLIKPVRVLHVVGNMDAGGLETLIMNWYRNIDRDKVQFDFLVHYGSKGFYEEEIIRLGGRVYHTTLLEDRNYVKYIKSLKMLFKEHKEYRIVHGHHAALGFLYLNEAKKANIPVRISHAHIANYSKTPRGILTHLLSRMYGRFANVHMACSNKAGKYMYGGKKYIVINNGIDTDLFKFSFEKRNNIRKEFDIDDKFVLIHVGRFHDQKNHSFLVDVFIKLLENYDNSFIIMIGNGPLKNRIIEKITNNKIIDKCLLLENRSDVNDLLCASDVFVFPSLYEGLPLTLVEAQTSGLPIVCSDSITNETKLIDDYYELSLEQNIEDWVNAINTTRKNNINREEAYKQVRKKGYDCKDVAKKMERFYLNSMKKC